MKTNSLDNQLLVAMRAKVLGIRKIRDEFNELKMLNRKGLKQSNIYNSFEQSTDYGRPEGK